MSAGLAGVLERLRCPHCAGDLTSAGGALRCAQGHAFDVARQGYVNLLPGNARVGTADTAAMVEARETFLGAGHYEVIAAAVAKAVDEHADDLRCLVEVGAGTAYYAAQILRLHPAAVAIALDASKHAARRAARAHDRIGSVVSDVWRPLPVKDGVVDVVLDVFAPRNGPEMRRVLRPGGVAVVVTPRPGHLAEVVEALNLLRVDARKPDRVDAALQDFTHVETTAVDATLRLENDAVRALALMGPSAWHVDENDLTRRLSELALPVAVSVSVDVAVYRPA